MAARTATGPSLFYETGPYIQEEWVYTGTFVAGTDTLNAIRPVRVKRVLAVKGNFATYTVSSGAYTFTFDSATDKPCITFIGHGR